MKILVSVHQFLPKYSSGTEVLAFETVKDLIKRGHDVRVLTAEPVDYETALNNPDYYKDKYQGIEVYRINHHLGTTPNPVRYEYANPNIAEIFQKVLEDFKPDVFHIMHCARLSASVIDKAKELSVPVVFTATDFWFVCPLSQLRLPDNSTCKGPNLSSTNCVTCYVTRTQPLDVIEKIKKLPEPIFKLINGVAKLSFVEKWEKGVMLRALVRRKSYMINQINKVNTIIAPTDIMLSMLSENGVNKNKLIKLPYGINIKYVQENTPVKKNRGVIKFAFIGTLYEHKGTHILIEAFNQLHEKYKNIELKIYGDLTHFPDYIQQLKHLSQDKESIKFLGTFPNSEIGEIFKDIDVLVVPSIWYENTPLVIYSSFSAKTPVLATNLGGMAEVVHNDINGYLFEKENIKDLKEQMEKFLLDETLLEKLSSGIKPVKSIEQNVNELEEIYQEIIK